MNSSIHQPSGNCSDWELSSPIDIPKIAQKTHYPDTGSGVLSSCGSSGDIALGNKTINIKDNVHIRADLCRQSACNPIFNNPGTDIHFVFIEGTINFKQVTTKPGSGPLVFVAYGADPASKTSVCPLGGAIYIGKDGSNNTSAPAAYFLSNNGVCLDETKFSTPNALGGIAGKNIYIATNSGTPFDLGFDISFPLSEIPINLSWSAETYRRL
jgi:hypothetical protein